MSQDPKLSLLWHSVSPHIHSGYGNVTKNVCFRLKALGYPIIITTYYGLHDGGMIKLGDVPILPSDNEDKYGKESVKYYVEKFQTDLPILHTDFWMFDWFASLENSCFYGPLDHSEYGKKNREVLKAYKEVITCSKFGQEEAARYGVKSRMIPHGVDTKVYHPMDKLECRKQYNFKKDVFLVGIVAANSDPEPRKGWDKMFLGVRSLLDEHPDLRKKVVVFAYTKPVNQQGFDLPGLAASIGIEKNVVFPERMTDLVGLPDEEMAMLYNCFDIFMNCARREGFGIPIIEAQACGVPGIASNFSSMPELVNGHGWLVRGRDIMFTPLNGKCLVPDQDDIAKKLEEAIFNDQLRRKYGEDAFKFAQDYDWDKLIIEQWLPLLKEKEREIYGTEPKFLDIQIDHRKLPKI